MLVDQRADLLADHLQDALAQVLSLQDRPPVGVDDRALFVHHIVELDGVLADIEVIPFDARLRALDRTVDQLGFDRHIVVDPQALHDPLDALHRAEAAHQLVLERQIEPRRAGVALAAGAPTQLVVDPARLVALGTDDMQPAQADHLLALGIGDPPGLRQRSLALLRCGLLDRDPLFVQNLLDQPLGIAAEQDVGATAGHIGRDRDCAQPPGLGDDVRLALVVLGVQHLVLDALALQALAQPLRGFHRGRADQHRSPDLLHLLDLAHHCIELGLLGAVDLVVQVLTDHGPVSRDHHHIEVIDLAQLLALSVGRTGHTGQLLVHTEIVLEGDRRQRDVLLLDRHALLGLDRLVQAIAPAPAWHLAPGELVDDDHLTVLDHIVAVAVIDKLRPQGVLEEMGELEVLRIVEALVVGDAEHAFNLGDAGVGELDAFGTLLDHEIAVRLEPLFLDLLGRDRAGLEVGHQPCEAPIFGAALLRRAGDDQRRARLVDQDVVDLIHDRIVQLALHELAHIPGHVVAQVIEAELVVGTVRYISQVGLAARAGAPMDQARILLIGVRIHVLRVVQRRDIVRDEADRQAEQVIDRAHPARADLGEVIVHRHQMAALALERVEIQRQGRDERLALAGLHLGDLALVQHDPADELDIVMTLAERAARRLAHGGEGFRQQIVEGFALRQPGLELIGLGAQLLVRERLKLRLQAIDRFDQRRELLERALVAVTDNLLDQVEHLYSPVVSNHYRCTALILTGTEL